MKVLRPGTYCSLKLSFFLIFVRYSRVLPCDVCVVHKKTLYRRRLARTGCCARITSPSSGVLPSFIYSCTRTSLGATFLPLVARHTRTQSASASVNRARFIDRLAARDPPLHAAAGAMAETTRRRTGRWAHPHRRHISGPAASTANYRQATAITSSPPAD